MKCWILLVIFSVGTSRSWDEQLLPGKLYNDSACHGSAGDILLSPSCSEGERIAINTLYANAKPRETGCPDKMTVATKNRTDCCVYDIGDCRDEYNGTSKLEYYFTFTGKQKDEKQAAGQKTSDKCQSFRDSTNYMMTTFYCISENVTVNIESDQLVSAETVYLLNWEYPNAINISTPLSNCSVSVPCYSNIIITVIDLALQNSSVCLQALDVVDGGMNTTFTCDDNNEYEIKEIYRSSSRFINIILRNEQQLSAGKLWLQLNATTAGVPVTLACGSSVQSPPPTCSPTTPALEKNKDPSPDLAPEILAVIIIFVIILAVVFFVVIFLCYKKSQNKKTRVGPDGSPSDRNESNLPSQNVDFEALPTAGSAKELPSLKAPGATVMATTK